MNPTLTLESLVFASPEVLSADLGKELALLDARSGIYYGMDAVGSRIWDLLEQPRALAEVLAVLVQEYKVDQAVLTTDLLDFAQELVGRGLLKVDPA